MFEGIPVVSLTPPVLLGITVMLLLLGKLVPRAILQDKIEEAVQWRQAYEKEREARAMADRQTAELLEVSRTTKRLIQGLFKATGSPMETEEDDVPALEEKK